MDNKDISSECKDALDSYNDPEINENTDDEVSITLIAANSMTLTTNIEIEALPDEIIEFILTYLPPYGDLESCSLVSKRWNQIVKNLVRRAKNNLQKGLLDFRLRWEVYSQHTAISLEAKSIINSNSFSNVIITPKNPSSLNQIIAGRFSHSAVRHGNSMYIFGGGSSSDTTFNDLWCFNLSQTKWERPVTKGAYPSPKGSASMVCWKDHLILFGGWRYPSLHPPYQPWCLFDELHYYDINQNLWKVNTIVPSPPPMAGHSATVHGDIMVIFGGYQISEGVNSNSNETWCLDLKNLKWWQPKYENTIKPPPRYGQIQMDLDEEHVLVVGGCGGANSIYSDAWLLDMSKDLWSWCSIPVKNKKFSASHMWCNPACKISNKLVVLGPTPNMPHDLSMMKHIRMPVAGNNPAAPGVPPLNNRLNPLERREGGGVLNQGVRNGPAFGVGNIPLRNAPNRLDNLQRINGQEDQYYANRRAILNQHQGPAHHLFNNNNNNNNQNANNNNNNNNNQILNNININNNTNNNNPNHNHLQPRTGRLSDLHNQASSSSALASSSPSTSATASSSPPSSSSSLSSYSASSPNLDRNTSRPNVAITSATPPAIVMPSTSSASKSPPSSASPRINGDSNGLFKNRKSNDIEAENRLQRNLALRSRDNEPLLPKRFDELYEDPIRMAAFNVPRSPRIPSRDHSERIRRMEEKMNALRNSRRSAPPTANIVIHKTIKEPSPKRVKRNVLSLFVCDLAKVLHSSDPCVEWVEYKNYGVIPGAPERLILSTMVAGNGELILFGGVHKETLSEITHQVSNSVHFLSAPKDIV